jgi:hypothetical protein
MHTILHHHQELGHLAHSVSRAALASISSVSELFDNSTIYVFFMLHAYKRMFIVNYMLLHVLMKSWCKLSEDGDNAEAYRSYVVEIVNRL